MNRMLNIVIALFISIVGGITFIWLLFSFLLWIRPVVTNGLKEDPLWQFFLSIFFGITASIFLFVFSYRKIKKYSIINND